VFHAPGGTARMARPCAVLVGDGATQVRLFDALVPARYHEWCVAESEEKESFALWRPGFC
jgi:hypothetical protein